MTFTTLSDLHQHLRGATIVRLVHTGLLELIIYHLPGRPNDVRKLTIWNTITFIIHDEVQTEFVSATSEPTELSEWF